MSPEAQRVAIAEACGWMHVFPGNHTPQIYGYPPKPTGIGCGDAVVPDYLTDLNAMHEAEKVFRDCEIKWREYRRHVQNQLEPHRHELHATAAQRAEAFLRTLNLYTS